MFTLDKSNDGVCWKEHWKYFDLKTAKKEADELFQMGYDITVWDSHDEKVYELNALNQVVAA